MPVVKVHPIKIEGRWESGVALDLHTTSSTPVGYNEFGHMQYDTVRPEIAELLFRLKNRADKDAAPSIIDTAADFLSKYRDQFDVLIPVPPSHVRAVQPVIILAEGIGKALNMPILNCIKTTRSTGQLKNITDAEERKKHVEGLYEIEPGLVQGAKILLFDDLFRSGTTMNAITDILTRPGGAKLVKVLTITKTRSNH